MPVTNMTNGYHVPAQITRDRLNHTLGDLELSKIVALLAEKGVKVSVTALQGVRSGNTQRVTRELAGAIRTLAHTHRKPVDHETVYLGTEDARAFITRCRRSKKGAGV